MNTREQLRWEALNEEIKMLEWRGNREVSDAFRKALDEYPEIVMPLIRQDYMPYVEFYIKEKQYRNHCAGIDDWEVVDNGRIKPSAPMNTGESSCYE